MIFQKEIPKIEYNREVLKSLSFIFNLSDLELDILVAMLNNNYTVINIDSREMIRKVLNKDKYLTNNYIKRLRDKQVLLDKMGSKMFYINPIILDILKEGEVVFKFKINDN